MSEIRRVVIEVLRDCAGFDFDHGEIVCRCGANLSPAQIDGVYHALNAHRAEVIERRLLHAAHHGAPGAAIVTRLKSDTSVTPGGVVETPGRGDGEGQDPSSGYVLRWPHD